MDGAHRKIVLSAVREVCRQREWWLFAAHVHTTHVHTVAQAVDPPEKVMNDLKAYASRRLNEAGLEDPVRKRWARHGSTRYLWDDTQLQNVIRYVLHQQGAPMALFAGPGICRGLSGGLDCQSADDGARP